MPERIQPQKQITEGFAQPICEPALAQVFGLVVDDVAALAKRLEVRRIAVARVVIEVRTGEHDKGRVDLHADRQLGWPGEFEGTAFAVPPSLGGVIPPSDTPQLGSLKPNSTPP